MKLSANAKINLTLDITGKNSDGYHYINTVMQAITLFDVVEIIKRQDSLVRVFSSDGSLGGENDIAYKAAQLFLKNAKLECGVDIKITKNIPVAAGLGGGSADAAAVILGLNRMFDNFLKEEVLNDIAMSVGSDVPFFLNTPTQYITGIGEKSQPLKNIPECFFVIVKNAEKKSTKEMYRLLDSTPYTDRPDTNAALFAIENGNLDMLCKSINNVFTPLWNIDNEHKIMIESGAKAVCISGSGPSVFAVFEKIEQAQICLEAFKNQGISAFLAQPAEKPILFE